FPRKEKPMKLLLVKQVFLRQVGNTSPYEAFIKSILENLGPKFEIEIAETAEEAEKIIAADSQRKFSAVLFASQAMIVKAIGIGENFPQIKFLIFCGCLENDRHQSQNVYLIKKDPGGIRHWQIAEQIMTA
ncbi:MAG TPA: hypothetical protein VMC41_03110, partial [Candidatus Nanoarchaeia archaeon]|nr:hypothetical protein [Candidatus Nanoarchaeia archaeon]